MYRYKVLVHQAINAEELQEVFDVLHMEGRRPRRNLGDLPRVNYFWVDEHMLPWGAEHQEDDDYDDDCIMFEQ
jgi:hypothetical protein